jgi:hypothetical protein
MNLHRDVYSVAVAVLVLTALIALLLLKVNPIR